MTSKDKPEGIQSHEVELVGRPMVLRDEGREFALDMERLEPDQVIEKIQKWNRVLDSITELAFRYTRPNHWVAYKDSDGESTPWLTAPGAESLVRRCGLRVEYADPAYAIESGHDADGDFVKYTCRLRVSLGRWASIVAEGHTTSRDRFFSRGGRLSAEKIDKGNLQQAAYSNALVNGVCRLLGIRRLSWDDVTKMTGGKITADGVQSAEFKSGGKGGASKGRRDKAATSSQRANVWREWQKATGAAYDSADDVGKRKISADFYKWAAKFVGKRERDAWTEGDVKRLLDEARNLAELGAGDAPDKGGADA